jgi:hypothetical protein
MNDTATIAVVCFLTVIIACCVRRQRRYWRELRANKPSGTLRWGYRLAALSILGALSIAMIVDSPGAWETFRGVVMLAIIFCVKITFSPAAIGLTLAACAVELLRSGAFPLFAVWTSLARVLTWRLPEEFRIVYGCVSLLWGIIILIGWGTAAEFPGADSASEGEEMVDSIASLPS